MPAPTVPASPGPAAATGANFEMTEPTSSAAPSTKHPAKGSAVLCPYCGAITPKAARCARCRGLLDPLSRQATQNEMGPWFVRDVNNPFRPGCSHHTLKHMAAKGRLHPETILRGPTTNQFWSLAKRTPGVSQLVGVCYACQEEVEQTDVICRFCGVSFEIETDRQHMGLAPVHLLPGQAAPEDIAASSDALTADPSAATSGKTPGSELHAIDDSADRLVRSLAAKLRRQRVSMIFITLVALAALGVIGVLVAEAHLGMPRRLTEWMLGPRATPASPAQPSPTQPASPRAGQPTNPPPAPAVIPPDPAVQAQATPPTPLEAATPGPGGGVPAAPGLTDAGTPSLPTIPAQTHSDQVLAPARELIGQDTQTSLQSALVKLAEVRKQYPNLSDDCRALERLINQRLEQLRLKRLP